MANSRRLLLPGYPHHLLRATSPGTSAFQSAADFRYAADELRELSRTYELHVHAFCILPDKVHILATPQREAQLVSTFMKAFSSRIALRNKRLKRSGFVWTPRFCASPVEPGQWAVACMAYIERLPVRLGIVRSAAHYHFSSFRVRADLTPEYWLEDLPEYARLGDERGERLGTWKKYLREGVDPKDEQFIEQALLRNRLAGSPRFAEQVQKLYGVVAINRGPGRPRKDSERP